MSEKIARLDKSVIDMVYPVGTIYMSVNSANPGNLFGGKWESIGSGRVLQGADATHTAGSTIEAGLPNITGKINRVYGEIHSEASGAFAPANGETKSMAKEWTQANDAAISFDASRCNAVYGRSNTVQPPAYVVYMWKRTA